MTLRATCISACIVSALAAGDSGAVSLNPGGIGQALVFPYYTVQTTGPFAFNTYLSITNTVFGTKALKVRFREGRNSRPVAEFNLYLSPNEGWAATLVPEGDGVRLLTSDTSCTSPALPAEGLLFSNTAYSMGDDGAGTGLDRTREGHIDVIEMGILTGDAAANVAHDLLLGRVANCAAVQGIGAANVGPVGAPSGGLFGSATLINVMNGMDLTYNADALANLSSASMYSAPGAPGTDFDSPQVDPVSFVVTNNVPYRLNWSRGIDAVTSVFMASQLWNEFILDAPTASKTDWVVTFPTRRFYVTSSGFSAPFSHSFGTSFANCEGLFGGVFDREGRPIPPSGGTPLGGTPYAACWSANAFAIWRRSGGARTTSQSDVLGSRNTLFHTEPPTLDSGAIGVPGYFSSGSLVLGSYPLPGAMTSLPTSLVWDLTSGSVLPGPVIVLGLPWTGFMARTFENGTLKCGSASCQGNYSGVFPHRRQ